MIVKIIIIKLSTVIMVVGLLFLEHFYFFTSKKKRIRQPFKIFSKLTVYFLDTNKIYCKNKVTINNTYFRNENFKRLPPKNIFFSSRDDQSIQRFWKEKINKICHERFFFIKIKLSIFDSYNVESIPKTALCINTRSILLTFWNQKKKIC